MGTRLPVFCVLVPLFPFPPVQLQSVLIARGGSGHAHEATITFFCVGVNSPNFAFLLVQLQLQSSREGGGVGIGSSLLTSNLHV